MLRMSGCSLAILTSVTFPAMAQSAPLFGAWVGQAQVGEKLKVNMTVFGLNKDTQSQLKATCMEAWAESEGNELNSLQTRIPLNLDYGKTLDRGGLLTLSSNVSMRDPVVRVHLASNCPLVTFVQTWDLQLDFAPAGQVKVNTSAGNANGQQVRELPDHAGDPTPFNLSGSPTLTASYRKPILKAEPVAQIAASVPAMAKSKTDKAKPVEGSAVQNKGVQDKLMSEPMPTNDPNLATLPQTKKDVALLEAPQQVSQQQAQQAAQLENMAMSKLSDQDSAPASASLSGWAKDPALTGEEMNLMPFILFGGVSLMMIAFGMWWGQRQSVSSDIKASSASSVFGKFFRKVKPPIKNQPDMVSPSPQSTQMDEEDIAEEMDADSPDAERAEPEALSTAASAVAVATVADKPTAKNPDLFSKQLFESFLGGTQSLDSTSDSHSNRAMKSTKSGQNEVKSLVSMVSMVSASQNVSPRPWKLPESFMPLLPASLMTDLSSDQFTEDRLKCEMGLIELAYLNAQQGEVLYDIQIAELLEAISTQRAQEPSDQAIYPPSDLIKDFVRSRVCELDSKQSIEKFTESLHAMNASKHCEKFSMADGLWLEFISDLDIR
ncbi:MAG: hypothetical protein QE278_08675 [Limnobacter sp.]|nr:hypothetical protein [Limnobacter sp.]